MPLETCARRETASSRGASTETGVNQRQYSLDACRERPYYTDRERVVTLASHFGRDGPASAVRRRRVIGPARADLRASLRFRATAAELERVFAQRPGPWIDLGSVAKGLGGEGTGGEPH